MWCFVGEEAAELSRRCAACLATATAWAVFPLGSSGRLPPVSGLRSGAHRVIHFAHSTVVSVVRLQVLNPERDPLCACAPARAPRTWTVFVMPRTITAQTLTAGERGDLGQRIWPSSLSLIKVKTVILSPLLPAANPRSRSWAMGSRPSCRAGTSHQ